MKLRAVLLLIGIACLVPAGANAATVRGVVVGKQHGVLLVAAPNGLVQTVSARASIGARLVGTHVVGRATRARIHGIVVKRIGTTMFLSSNKHLLVVHTRRVLASAATPVVPPPGSVVNTTVGVGGNGDLEEQDEETVGQVSGNVQVQATVTAVGAGTVTLTVNGQPLTVNLPGGLTLPASVVGQTVTINVSLDNHAGGGDDDGNDGNDDGGGGGDD